jgi:parallel beta-helix repeat protein
MPLKNDWQNGDLFTPAAANDMANAVNSVTSVTVSRFLPGAASNQAAIAAAISEAGVNGVVDFEGVSYVTTGTVTVSTAGVTLQNGGIRPTGQFMALYVTAADVTVRDMKFSRSQSYNFDDDTHERCCVSVAAQRFSSYNCDYLSTNLACVYFANGSCDGAIISGGEMTGTAATQSGCGVLAAAGATGHRNITVTGVYVHDTTDGILLFDSSDCLVAHNRVESLRRLPTVTLTGWTLVSGTTWRQRTASGTPGVDGPPSDRADGPSVVFTINGTQSAVESYDSTTPSSNRASISGGFVYINLATNPNSATITSNIVSGYAYMIYSFGDDGSLCSRNRLINNTADDIDGFGIYMQLGGGDTARGNIVAGNILTNVCLEGSQTETLAFSGLTISNGADTLVSGNRVNGVGSSGKAVPGVYVNWSGTFGAPSGRIVDTIVSGSFTVGFDIRASNWSLQGCHSYDNANTGFRVYTTLAAVVIDNVTLTDCHAYGNTTEGFAIDGGVAGIGYVSANIIGGTSIGNTRRGVILNSRSDGSTVKNCSIVGMKVTDNDTGGLDVQVQLSNAVSGITVTGCQIESSSGTGIFFASTATDLVLTNNQFSIPTPETSPLPVPVRVGGAKNSAAQWRGAGSPEGVVTAPVGSTFQRTDGSAGSVLYLKDTGTGNTGWVVATRSVDVQVFTSSGTWTKPANAVSVHVRCIASGGGGGAGARGPSGTALSGGGGGGGGGMCEMITPASDLTSTVTVTVGAGGAGATGQTSNGTAGANGTAGTRSSFGAYLYAAAGGGGTGGGLASAGTAGSRGQGQFVGSAGGAGSATGAAGAIGTATQSAAGGAAGGGITTAPAATAGGVGGSSETAQLSGGTAGSGANGGAGNSGGAKTPGSGGGGGGASTTVDGFSGGVGGTYGGGGGGGGASLNGNTSGAGGTGGPGICVVTTYF